jgi:Ribbon-helix-helix protein, copG family
VPRVANQFVSFQLDEKLIKRMEHAAIDQDVSIHELAKRAIEAYLAALDKINALGGVPKSRARRNGSTS